MSILATSPTDARMFSATVAAALGDMNAAVIVQQLHYWILKKGVGVIIDGVKYVYNTFVEWVNQQFPWLTPWQFRKAMSKLRSLDIVKVIRHKAKQWNQTNYYTLNCDRLVEFIRERTARTIEISELWNSSSQSVNSQHLELSDRDTSLYEPKNTNHKKETSKQPSDRASTESSSFAAASPLDTSQEKETASSSASPNSAKSSNSSNRKTVRQNKTTAGVDEKVNKKWRSQLKNLDDAGIEVNQTLISLIKSYSYEEVENALALLKTRKRQQHIPNPAGYFTQALKQGWANKLALDTDSDADSTSVFRYWYDLAKKIGCCQGQEVRDGEQWVMVSGSWEKWSSVVVRGYSINYLKKILKRYGGRS